MCLFKKYVNLVLISTTSLCVRVCVRVWISQTLSAHSQGFKNRESVCLDVFGVFSFTHMREYQPRFMVFVVVISAPIFLIVSWKSVHIRKLVNFFLIHGGPCNGNVLVLSKHDRLKHRVFNFQVIGNMLPFLKTNPWVV